MVRRARRADHHTLPAINPKPSAFAHGQLQTENNAHNKVREQMIGLATLWHVCRGINARTWQNFCSDETTGPNSAKREIEREKKISKAV